MPTKRRKAKPGEAMAFLKKAVKSRADDCILWPFFLYGGYGGIKVGGKFKKANRLVLIMAIGPHPVVGMQAAHDPIKCNNKDCVNPKHLRWATAKENARDRELAGTTARGERNGNAQVTLADARFIKASGERVCDLATQFGVHRDTIHNTKSGRTWAEA